MERNRLNYWIDILLLISFVISAVTGLVLKFAFVSGQPGVGSGVLFLGTSKMVWIPWHTISSFAMVLLVLIHLVLHFGWLRAMTKTLVRKREE